MVEWLYRTAERLIWRDNDEEQGRVFDNSLPDLSCGVLLGFLEGRHGHRTGELSSKERG
jgi:hypothetical protein